MSSEQPSVVYSYSNSDGEEKLRELRVGGDTLRRGTAIERESSRSSPDTRLPHAPIPGQSGLMYDDCGDDIPAFFCTECGNPVYVGRTCQSPSCSNCWPSGVKREVVEKSRKQDGLRRRIYAYHQGRKNVDFNHVVASLPSFSVDSEEPVERFLKVVKHLLEENFDVRGFHAVYHPWRIKDEHRKPVYDHGGEQGSGDKMWKDIIGREDWLRFVKFEPHFHLFFPLERGQFDYHICNAIEDETGILFHRIEKNPGDDDDHRSVADFEDLVHQLTYVYSHAGDDGGFVQRMKGWLHTTNPPGDMEDRALAAVSAAAPKLLGEDFANVSDQSCTEDVPVDTNSDSDSDSHSEVESATTTTSNYTTRVERAGSDMPNVSRSEWDASPDTGFRGDVDHDWSVPVQTSSASSAESTQVEQVETETCGGQLVSIHNAEEFLNDDDWSEQAVYAIGLEKAYLEWKRQSEDRPTHDGVCPPPSESEGQESA